MLLYIIKSIRIFIILSLILGILYPLIIIFIGQLAMKDKANGSLIIIDDKIRGSKLIGQEFKNPKYFYSRPSAVNHDAANSGASNLGPSNKQLFADVKKRIAQIRLENNLDPDHLIPADMALQSASGLDPHISIENALLQVPRISKIRAIPEKTISDLIENNKVSFINSTNEGYINVLMINISLDNNNF